jgi:integrase
VLSTISKLFNWSVERGYLDASPAVGVKAPAKEIARDRVLDLKEIKKLWKAADEIGYPWGPWLKLMFATGGQREGDISRMQWPEIRGTWWEIEEPTKSDSSHRVPLSTFALEILDEIPRFEGPYVFSTRAGEKPIRGFSKAKALLDEKSKVTGWRFHDVRRTMATHFGEHLGKHPYVIERIQNRRSGTIKGVMAVYNRATYEEEMADALGEWGQFLQNIAQTDNVVALRG